MAENQGPIEGDTSADLLMLIAWITLISGFIAGAFLAFKVSVVEVPTGFRNDVKEVHDTSMVWLGFGAAFSGIVWFFIMRVIVATFRHTVFLRRQFSADPASDITSEASENDTPKEV